ncbi:putative oxygen-independent coproporphyrinogen III oxidase [Aurantimicrobium minutum]|uniref:radical SAM family heme chaperone HemW n=1 Tax=Aurantimicrobium minutum TaxID=708131 RepID=UPI0024736CD7|nr:radical SAM family heme chaperone HemW [Aurantimicrobium minutum]MDH6532888.1 putative oxygen-independent coproporphyrinogen III oxidase [Aurantimicrobium minutum]
MAGPLPEGNPMPTDGTLPDGVSVGADLRSMSAYVHVPFCRVRCGYCDFNTYTATELSGVSQATYVDELEKEIILSGRVLERAGITGRPLSSVFFGGGTPTLLPATDLVRALESLRELHGVVPGAEITTEANPDTLTYEYVEELARAGFTRISIGMQSAVPTVLATLDRTHNPQSVAPAVEAARAVGLQVSVDLIYGTPGETLSQWRESLESAIALDTGHISAYALIVEDGTALERRIRRGELPAPDDDLEADMYELADQLLGAAGFEWYEVSNWAKSPTERSVHNLMYWQGQDWWGYGPGAHSHIGGTRFWNVKHPAAYAQQLALNNSPSAGWEQPDHDARELERILLGSRLREGISTDGIHPETLVRLSGDGLIDSDAASRGLLILTLTGRLRADDVVRRVAFE